MFVRAAMELIVAMADISVNGRYNAGEPVMEAMQTDMVWPSSVAPGGGRLSLFKAQTHIGILCLGFAVQRLQTSRREAASCVERCMYSPRGVL